tara:strand:+ start:503 stop:625 length:123 start_codon:yes stop_codon:yes gene_type:complete
MILILRENKRKKSLVSFQNRLKNEIGRINIVQIDEHIVEF